MECPNCNHATSNSALLQCSHCGEAFERGSLEEFQHLEYLATWLEDRSEISNFQRKELLDIAEKKQKKILAQILPKGIEKDKPAPATPPLPQTTAQVKPQPAPAPIAIPKPEVKPVPQPIKAATVSAVTPKPIAPPKPQKPPKPIAPPKPQRPPVDWKKVRDQFADAVTSGALLRALLYLGAFMIVISASVLVIRFWNQFNQVLQLTFIASVPLMFYAGGWALRTRLNLVQGGTVLTGIGAILVAVDFAAIYQFGGLAEQVNGPIYWLAVSVFCTALYTFTTWRIKGEFFDYLTLISGASILVAFTRIPKPALALEWTVVTVTFSGMLMTYLAGRYWKAGDTWRDFARASRYLSQILIPSSVFYVMYSAVDLPILSAFVFAMIGYVVLAWQFPSIVFAYSALVASIGAVLFGLRGTNVQPEWYALAASVLALIYILIGQRLQKVKSESNILQNYTKALNTTGLLLIGAAVVSGFVISFTEVWAGVLALTMATLDLMACAYFFKHSRYTLLASSLFVLPFTFTFWRWFTDAQLVQSLGWLTVAWGGLALTYIGLGVLLRKAEGHARWLHALAQGLTLFSLGALPLEYLVTINDWSYVPSSTTLGLSLVIYLASILLHDSGRHPALSNLVAWMPLGLGKSVFLWLTGVLFPVWIAVGWYGNQLNGMWFGTLLTGLGIAYIGIGQRLAKRAVEYRLPLHTFSYFLFVIGIFIAIPNSYSYAISERYPLLISLTVTFVSLGFIAYIYNRVVETTLASLLFIWLFVLSLGMLKVPQQAHGFAFILLAGLVYIPIAIQLNKIKRSRDGRHPTSVFMIGYALSLYALFNSVYWGANDTSLTWVTATVPLIATALYVFSTSYFKDDKEVSTIFAWASAITLAVTFRQALTFFKSPNQFDPFAWTIFAALYMIVERLLSRTSDTSETDTAKIKRFWFDRFHKPLATGWIALAVLGLALNMPGTLAAFQGFKLANYLPPIIAQVTLVLLLIASSRLYRIRLPLFIEPAVAFLPVTLFFIGYGETLFGKSLTTPQYALTWTGLGIIHILAAILTDRTQERYSHGLYLGGYALLTWAVLWSMIERPTLVWTLGLWILTSIASALLVHFGRHQTWDEFTQEISGTKKSAVSTFTRNLFQWLAAWAFPIWCVIFLRHIDVSDAYSWLGLAVPSLAYLGLALWFKRIDRAYTFPLHSASQVFAFFALVITATTTERYFFGRVYDQAAILPLIVLQIVTVIFYAASAWTFKSRALAHLSAWLSIVPISMAWKLFDQPFKDAQFAIPWLLWSLLLLGIGFALDRNKTRYSHGPYLAGYVLATVAVLWSVFEHPILVWTFGSWILFMIVSALLVHFGRHQTWDDLIQSLLGQTKSTIQTATRNAFQWLAAWTLPIWSVILLREMNVPDEFSWLGLVVPPLAYLGLALWTRRFDSSYVTPLYSAAQFFTVIGLLITIPVTIDFLFNYYLPFHGKDTLLAFIIIQSVAVVFYAFSAWMRKSRFFSPVATWLSISAFSMAWQGYGVELTPIILIAPWLMWSTVLLVIGYALDKNQTRYAHGPYLGGYALMIYALVLSTVVRLTNIYALAITILLAILSYLVVHFGRHQTFEDFINRFWKKSDETTRQIVSTIFLFYSAYAIPVLLTQYLAYIKLDLAWRGVSLAIAAPLYIAVGLLIRNSKSRGLATVPTWALYSAGYALTAIGAMVSFGDEQLAIYVLTLNAIVYAVSAYIFQQSFWLYLTTVLLPIITLLTLHHTNRLETNLVAWIFMAFAFVYLAIGQVFDRLKKTQSESNDIHPFAAPFYMPGFLLSAIALALASNERMLAIQVYSAGVVLYALSSILFRETLFYYPAAWLAAVPYYLAITLTSLETRWYGLAWLPLILIYVGLGHFVFHKRKLAPLGQGFLADWLTHPAMPFYLLAYSLSVSMISLSYAAPLPLTIAFGVAAVIYFVSAYLFKKPAWIYPALFAAHMTVLAYFTIDPSGGELRYITIPFLVMTWITSLVGSVFERNTPLTDENKSYRFSFLNRLFGHAWARPFFAFAILEMVIWQSLALTGYDTAIIVASGHALLFALFSILWVEGALVYGAVGFSLLAAGASLNQADVQLENAVAVYGGIGFGLYLLGRILDALSARIKSLTVWLTPLMHSSITLTALAVIINLPAVGSHMTATAATLAFAGALYTAIAYRGQIYRLGYLGMALLEFAWVLALIINDVAQPQWYAIPGGLYFIGLGYMEWIRNKSKYAIGLEILGLGVLLVTSFAQSLNGETGLPYFVLLLAEGLIVIWWGVYQKRKIPFFTGIGASALNIVAQVIILINVYDINRWLVAFGAGLLIMGLAIYIERSREQLRLRARELSATLEKWE